MVYNINNNLESTGCTVDGRFSNAVAYDTNLHPLITRSVSLQRSVHTLYAAWPPPSVLLLSSRVSQQRLPVAENDLNDYRFHDIIGVFGLPETSLSNCIVLLYIISYIIHSIPSTTIRWHFCCACGVRSAHRGVFSTSRCFRTGYHNIINIHH